MQVVQIHLIWTLGRDDIEAVEGPPDRRIRGRLRPLSAATVVLGMLIEPCQSAATQSSLMIVI